jgi:hypothetical protein
VITSIQNFVIKVDWHRVAFRAMLTGKVMIGGAQVAPNGCRGDVGQFSSSLITLDIAAGDMRRFARVISSIRETIFETGAPRSCLNSKMEGNLLPVLLIGLHLPNPGHIGGKLLWLSKHSILA